MASTDEPHSLIIRGERASHGTASADPAGAEAPRGEPSGWRSQFASPRGLGGRFAGWLMARENAPMNAACVDWLVLAPADRVLEIGFGHERTLAWIAQRAPSGFVAGVDPSAEMLRMASRHNRRALQSGRVAPSQAGGREALGLFATR